MSKDPFVTLKKVEEIVKIFPTPFHLYDERGIRRTAEEVNQAFAWNSQYREFFAVKALPNPKILTLLQEYGCGCDCSSKTELLLAQACGFRGDQIMFSSNDTPDEEYLLANQLGAIINLDDISHIDQLRQLFPVFPETMSCRYNPGGTFNLNNEIMGNPGDAKYGMTTDQIFAAFSKLKSLGVKHFGLHAFLASNTLGDDYYAENARVLCELAVKLERELDCHIKFINLSGGVGIPYLPDQEPNHIDRISLKVRKIWNNVLENNHLHEVALYTEMGRFMTGPHGCLIAKAIHYKNIHKQCIGVDACAADLMRPAMYGAYHHITVLGKENIAANHVYDIVGSLCENNDKFAIDRALPRINIGDYLAIHDTGAHGRAMGYNYNGKLRCGEVLLKEDGTFDIIRRKETPADYFATLDVCPEILQLLSPIWEIKNPELRQYLE